MADAAPHLARLHPLAGRRVTGAGVEVGPAPAAFRASVRCGEAGREAVGRALGLSLPARPLTSAAAGSRVALWLGPDEWLVIDEAADPSADLAACEALHAAVDISHRNTALLVGGPGAADLLNAGCPLDLSAEAFGEGACTRTVLGKAEIVLHRAQAELFRVEVWRSFADYVFTYLSTAARDPA